MALPTLLFGGSQGALYTPDPETADDDALVGVQTLLLTNIIAPASPAGDCIFPILHMTTVAAFAADIMVTLLVDGVAKTPHVLHLAGTGIEIHEIDLTEAYPLAPVPALVQEAPRGSSAQVRVTGPSGIEITVMQLEYEIVRETRQASA